MKFSVLEKVPILKDCGIFALPNEGLLVDLNISLEYSEAYIKKSLIVIPLKSAPGAKILEVTV